MGKPHKVIRLLLERGAEVAFHTDEGFSLLEHACILVTLSSFRMLLEYGADANEEDGGFLEERLRQGNPAAT